MYALTYQQFLKTLGYYELHRERELIEAGVRMGQVRAELEARERALAMAAHLTTFPDVQPASYINPDTGEDVQVEAGYVKVNIGSATEPTHPAGERRRVLMQAWRL